MHELEVGIRFFQPVRIVPWKNEDERKHDAAYMRGGTYARWHMENEALDEGRPYITGSLLRSACLTEIEKIISLHNLYDCCSKPDKSRKGLCKPAFFRKRPVYVSKKDNYCTKDAPCIQCLIKGRYDDALIKRKKDIKPAVHNFTLHFSNLKSENTENILWGDSAFRRIVNRVDPIAGKAKDFFQIYELDPALSGSFNGKITINVKEADKIQKIKKLLAMAMAQIKVLAGSICRVDIISEDHDELIKGSGSGKEKKNGSIAFSMVKRQGYREKINESAENIFNIFRKDQKLRRIADIIRDLRRKTPSYIESLPRGMEGGKASIWDQRHKKDGQSLREILKASSKGMTDEKWRHFCEELGQAVYKLSKSVTQNDEALPRLLGSTEFTGKPPKHQEKEKSWRHERLDHEAIAKQKNLITGRLKAVTPFFFGIKADKDQTSDKILLTSDGRFRIPASVIRGAFRRDLRELIGDGCNMPVGKQVCRCKVCRIMSRIIIEDGISSCSIPPEIRYRVRLDGHTGTVEDGALFDMEVGYQGMTFPFRLHLDLIIDKELRWVLDNWNSEKAFLGGHVGSGYGRFSLDNVKHITWSISEIEDHEQYLIDIRRVDYGKAVPLPAIGEKRNLPWDKINIEIELSSPLLTRDYIQAMLDSRNPDSVMYKKVVLNPEISESVPDNSLYAIKGESFRGVFRNALAMTSTGEKEDIFDKDHEECDCVQCRIFGSVHHQGSIRFEDLEVKGMSANVQNDVVMDHVAIDRFSGGGIDQMKFDEYALPGSPGKPLVLNGVIWIKKSIREDAEAMNAISEIMAELRDGNLTLGGLSAIGYGRIKNIEIKEKPKWLNLPEIKTVSLSFEKKPAPSSDKFESDPSRIYYPYYFLPLEKDAVKREKHFVSHIKSIDRDGSPLLTGKIKCALTTLGPIFISGGDNDYFGMKSQDNLSKHDNFGFYRLNGTPAIPGSSIRGMVSSVYEALTNSCFRVMDHKKRLSWRMEAKHLDEWKPGLVYEEDGILKIREMNEVRLPVYDNHLLESLIKKKSEEGYYEQPTKAEKIMLKYAEKNKLILKNQVILNGEKKVEFYIIKNNKVDPIGSLEKPGYGEKYSGPYQGYVYFSGANKLIVKNEVTEQNDNIPANVLEIKHNSPNPVLREIEVVNKNGDKEKRKRVIVEFYCRKDNVEYSMEKRCERIFYEKKEKIQYRLHNRVIEKYQQLCREYKDNRKDTDIPDVFQTILPENDTLSHGDLVYFLKNNKRVTDIIPVRISRIIDDVSLGKKFPNNNDSYTSCLRDTNSCIENCDECSDVCHKVSEYFKPHPLGLCPACHLFGTPFYKGRVSFGTAFNVNQIPVWYKSGPGKKGRQYTLPRLDIPRTTWSIPDKKMVIPGRKFYIHHPWSVDKNETKSQDENNRTIEPLCKDNVFEFEINFHRLRKWELGLLIYSLELENTMAHKIGMGKALGFGSIQIQISDIALQQQADERISVELDKLELIQSGCEYINNQTRKNLEELMKFPSKKVLKKAPDVRYPSLEKEKTANGKNELPGYVDLCKMDKKDRIRMLSTPWTPWHPWPYAIRKG